MQEYHREEIKKALKILIKSENIQTVSLSNNIGIIKYSTSDSLLNSSLSIKHRSCAGCHLSDNKVLEKIDTNKQFIYDGKLNKTWTIIPVYNSKSCSEAECHIHTADERLLGIIEIVASTTDLENTIWRSHIRLILYSLMLVIVVFLILRYFHQRLISKPVKELVEGTKQVALGKLDHVIPKGKAEFAELSDAFNSMQRKLKESQHQLIFKEKLISIGKLAAGVAHEINNPLTGILSFSESLLMETDEDDPKRKDYNVIREEALRCRTIVKNLLDFTRQEVPELNAVDINKPIQQIVEIVKRQDKFSKIKISEELSNSLPDVLIDVGQIKQVLLNLLINAAEAISDDGTIYVSTRYLKIKSMVEIKVEDTGQGISVENLDKIFEPFFSTKGGKTNGLGLSISQEIIKNQNGDIKVESKIGEGTTFFITLPIN
jgi:two-component system NtrC family sensor kinase